MHVLVVCIFFCSHAKNSGFLTTWTHDIMRDARCQLEVTIMVLVIPVASCITFEIMSCMCIFSQMICFLHDK